VLKRRALIWCRSLRTGLCGLRVACVKLKNDGSLKALFSSWLEPLKVWGEPSSDCVIVGFPLQPQKARQLE